MRKVTGKVVGEPRDTRRGGSRGGAEQKRRRAVTQNNARKTVQKGGKGAGGAKMGTEKRNANGTAKAGRGRKNCWQGELKARENGG